MKNHSVSFPFFSARRLLRFFSAVLSLLLLVSLLSPAPTYAACEHYLNQVDYSDLIFDEDTPPQPGIPGWTGAGHCPYCDAVCAEPEMIPPLPSGGGNDGNEKEKIPVPSTPAGGEEDQPVAPAGAEDPVVNPSGSEDPVGGEENPITGPDGSENPNTGEENPITGPDDSENSPAAAGEENPITGPDDSENFPAAAGEDNPIAGPDNSDNPPAAAGEDNPIAGPDNRDNPPAAAGEDNPISGPDNSDNPPAAAGEDNPIAGPDNSDDPPAAAGEENPITGPDNQEEPVGDGGEAPITDPDRREEPANPKKEEIAVTEGEDAGHQVHVATEQVLIISGEETGVILQTPYEVTASATPSPTPTPTKKVSSGGASGAAATPTPAPAGPPASRDLDRYPYFSVDFPARRQPMKPASNITPPSPGFRTWPDPEMSTARSPLYHLLYGD